MGGGWGPGTLLGPEGPGRPVLGRAGLLVPCCWSACGWAGVAVGVCRAGLPPVGLGLPRVGWVGLLVGVDRCRPFFENCTVDASIFVGKLVRAHGGCLGTRSR